MTLDAEYCYSVSFILSDMFFIVMLRVIVSFVVMLSLVVFPICLFTVMANQVSKTNSCRAYTSFPKGASTINQ
jgi:hypothetical protein